MKKWGIIVCAVLLPGLLSTAATAKEKLSGEQITALISGNTTYGRLDTKNQHGHTYRRADGTFVGWNSADGATKGTWRVSGDMYCGHGEGKFENCQEVYDEGDGTYGRYVQPKSLAKPKKLIGIWTKVVPGNPENLQ